MIAINFRELFPFRPKLGVPPDEVTLLLGRLQKETGLAFSEIKEVSFSWGLGGEEICQGTPSAETTIRGKGFSVADLPMTRQGLIGTFLEKEGFEADQANLVNEEIRGRTGYRKGDLVCLHLGWVSGGEEGLKQNPITSGAEVKCGYVTGN